jgi:flagellin-like protein
MSRKKSEMLMRSPSERKGLVSIAAAVLMLVPGGARGGRRGTSEAIGAILAIAMTLIAGAATWGYVSTQAGTSEAALISNAQNTNNYLGEQYRIIDMTFGSSTQTTFWIYNLGTYTLSVFQVRLYDSAGLINVLYNYTTAGGITTDRVYDLKAAPSYYYSTCRLAGSTYESPKLTSTAVKTTTVQTISLTIPAATANCPSYGQTFNSGTAYTVVVTGLYGNVVTFYGVK